MAFYFYANQRSNTRNIHSMPMKLELQTKHPVFMQNIQPTRILLLIFIEPKVAS